MAQHQIFLLQLTKEKKGQTKENILLLRVQLVCGTRYLATRCGDMVSPI